MHATPIARLTPIIWGWLVRQHIQDPEPLAHVAAQAGICLRTA